MTDTRAVCNCGFPQRANYYTSVTVGRDIPGGTETTSFDNYTCTEHTQEFSEGERVAPFGNSQWVVIESTTTHLR